MVVESGQVEVVKELAMEVVESGLVAVVVESRLVVVGVEIGPAEAEVSRLVEVGNVHGLQTWEEIHDPAQEMVWVIEEMA